MRLLILAAIAIIVLLTVTPSPASANPDAVTFSTNVQFDAGTKVNTETSTDHCTLQTFTNQFGLAGVGEYIGIKPCSPSGTKDFSDSMQASYDFETLRTGKLQDYVSTNDCTISNGPASVAAFYGSGYSFTSGSSQSMNCPGAGPTTGSWSVFFVFKPTVSGSKVVVNLDTASGNFFIAYGMNCNLAADPGVLHACQTNTNDASATVSINTFHSIAWVKNAGNTTHNLYVDGLWKSKAASVSGGTTDINIAKWTAGTPDYFDGIIDEMSIWDRVLNNSEVQALSTDGRSLSKTSGNWQSVLQSVDSRLFSQVYLTWSPNASAARYVSAIAIIDDAGSIVFKDETPVKSGFSHTYPIASIFSSSGWRVRVNLTGDSTTTISVSLITVTYALASTIGKIFSAMSVLGFVIVMAMIVSFALFVKLRRDGSIR